MAKSTDRGSSEPWTRNLQGPSGQLFGDPAPGPDETAFQVDNTSAEYYNSPYYKQHENDVLAVPMGPPTGPLELTDVVGADFLAPITAAKQISFHVVGDTGASSTASISNEATVADAMAAETKGEGTGPAFCFHLGDVIYNFGEAEYYYDQFYEPFRGYDRPIVAIPGNHDGEVTYISGGSRPDVPSLQAFIANFCTPTPQKPQDAGGLARTMDFLPGDVGYIEQSKPHYVENIGDDDLVFLEVFPTAEYQDVSLGEWLAHTPSRPVNEHLGTGEDFLTKITKTEVVITPEK